jgi:hypothetical protein
MQDASFLTQANIPIRDYPGSVPPGLADRPISQNAELTPAAELSGPDRLTTDIVTGVVRYAYF